MGHSAAGVNPFATTWVVLLPGRLCAGLPAGTDRAPHVYKDTSGDERGLKPFGPGNAQEIIRPEAGRKSMV